MSDDVYSSEFLAEIEKERSYVESRSSYAKVNRVKIGRGERWLLRLVPAKLSKKGLWFSRVGWHWVNGMPYVCPKESSEERGGGHDACEICDLADDLARSTDDLISQKARRIQLTPQWLMYALVYERDDGRGDRPIRTKLSRLFEPWELQLYKSDFLALTTVFERYLRRVSPLSILDPYKGCDLWFEKTAKGMMIERDDSQPITETTAATDELLAKTHEAIEMAKTAWSKPLTGRKLDDLLVKIEDHCAGRAGRGRGRDRRDDRDRDYEEDDRHARGRGRGDVDEEEDEPRGHSRGGHGRDSRDDDRERDSTTARQSGGRRSYEESRQSDSEESRGRGRATEDREESRGRGRATEDREESHGRATEERRRGRAAETEPRGRTEVVRDRDDEPPSRRVDELDESGVAVDRVPPPPARRGAPPRHRSEDEDDHLPEDDRDKVAPAKAADTELVDETPPSPPPVHKSGLGAEIRQGIASFKNR